MCAVVTTMPAVTLLPSPSTTSTAQNGMDIRTQSKEEGGAAQNVAAVLYGPLDLRMEHRPLPAVGPRDVVVFVQATGICGSDLHYYTHGRCGRFQLTTPMTIGHESSGLVVAIGPDVRTLRPGDRVAIEPGVPERDCIEYKAGRYHLCKQMQFCATPPVHGTLTRYFVHPEDFCFKLPAGVGYEEGALMEPLAVAVHACRRANVCVGAKVLITGAGPVGLLVGMVAKAMGAVRIGITDVSQSRLDFASSIKCVDAVYLIKPNEKTVCDTNSSAAAADPLSALKPEQDLAFDVNTALFGSTGGSESEINEPDCTIECSGALSSVRLGIFATRAGGCIALVGRGALENSLPLPIAASKELDIRGIFRYVNCYPIALKLIASKQADVKPLVTHRFELEQAREAFEFASRSDTGAIKVIIKGPPPSSV